MPPEIAKLSREMLRSPVMINADRQAAPATGVMQAVYPVRGDLKNSLLLEMLNTREDMQSVLVFTRTKHRTNRVHEFLTGHHIPVARIHGNRSQAQRAQALQGFKTGRFRVLVATDIAARGIDVIDLSHVVNFDVPHLGDDYIHRVGRTARAGAEGHAFTFVSPEEEPDLRTIERAIGKKLPRLIVDAFNYGPAHAPRKRHTEPDHRRSRPRNPRESGRGSRGAQGGWAGAHPAAGRSSPGGARRHASGRRPRG
jgi:ATP-dependent RNA helicase RhlE